jgi:High potential iron-sulfur protein
MTDRRYPRRSVLKGALLGVAAVPAAAWFGRADAAVKLDPNDPQAKALGYVEDASAVDTKANPNYKAGQHCGNCLQAAVSSDPMLTCNIFPGKLVNANGWCKVWVKRG